jgi:DNA-binding HxlR family transcriptional regulator
MTEKGFRYWQLQKMEAAAFIILRYLGDNKWHRYQELLEKTKLSSATLSKHLKVLERGVVEKKMETESGVYPYPVSYRIRENYQIFNDLLNLPINADQSEKDNLIEEASNTLGRTMRKITQNYKDDKNREALGQSQEIAVRLYFNYIRKLETSAEP